MQKDNINYLENRRTIFDLNDEGVNYYVSSFGFILYIILFVILVPYILIKNNVSWDILAAYFPNLDLVATIIGYHGGPMNSFIWTHLYNPTDTTLTGYVSSNLINLFALLGVTYVIAYYTFTKKGIYKGWSRAFIMLPMTYFIPSNIIIYYMNMFGDYLNNYILSRSLIHYLLVTILGLLMAVSFILGEAFVIKNCATYITKFLKFIFKN